MHGMPSDDEYFVSMGVLPVSPAGRGNLNPGPIQAMLRNLLRGWAEGRFFGRWTIIHRLFSGPVLLISSELWTLKGGEWPNAPFLWHVPGFINW